jgi:hypothetical protein
MKLTVKERFYDKKEFVYVEKKEVIERDNDRAQELIAAGVAVQFEEKKPKAKKEKAEEEKPAE